MKLYLSCLLLLVSFLLVQGQAPPVPPPPALPIGVEENTKEELKIWSNNSQLNIDATAFNEVFSLSIYNINGQLLHNEKFSSEQFVSINSTTFAQGIIIVQVTNETINHTRKLFLK